MICMRMGVESVAVAAVCYKVLHVACESVSASKRCLICSARWLDLDYTKPADTHFAVPYDPHATPCQKNSPERRELAYRCNLP